MTLPDASAPDDPASTPGLPITGERTVPDVADENYWFQRHVAAYRHVAARIDGTVVDAGCGEGYGLAILRDAGARGVIGVELDPVVVAHARHRYAGPRIDVIEADLTDLPLVNDTMDAVVSLQVVEHLPDVGGCLAELARITRPGGIVVVATPNRLTFTPGGEAPLNPFHVREFDAEELAAAMTAADLEVVTIEGVHHGPRLTAALGEHVPGDDWAGALADPQTWSPRLSQIVHAVTPDDFVVTEADVDTSLDLLAWARVDG